MNVSNFLRCVLFVSVWCIAGGARDLKARGEQPEGDDPIEVSQSPKPLGTGTIEKCFVTVPSTTSNVRFQSVKTSTGKVYTRQLVTSADLPCFDNSASKVMTSPIHIGACADATFRKGFNSFSWEDGVCTAYLAWRPKVRADCSDGGSKVVYVADIQLTPFAGGDISDLSAVFRYGDPDGFLDIIYSNYCGFSASGPKGFKLRWNKNVVEMLDGGDMLDGGITSIQMTRKMLCYIISDVSLWSVDEDGEVNSDEVKVIINRDDINWLGLQYGGCLYQTYSTACTYDSCSAICNETVGLDVFVAKVDGEAATFVDALTALSSDSIGSFVVGLRATSSTTYEWQGGLAQPVPDDAVWASGQPVAGYPKYGYATATNTVWKISVFDTDATRWTLTCYDPSP